MQRPLDTAAIRGMFPGLQRLVGEHRAVFFDGPAGSQAPQSVADAVSHYLLHQNANEGGPFVTSRESDAMVARARDAFRDFFGATSPDEIVFGANMTTLTFHLSRALARTWRRGDVVLVTQSDHDANVTPWVLAARDAGVEVRFVAINPDSTLDRADFERKLSDRTRLVAFGAASNLTGTIHQVADLAALARRAGARTFVDAVHYAPHARMDVRGWGCDFAACSAYKFFGPHLGVLFGRRELFDELEAYKVRPAANEGPEKWQTGTANFEGIAGGLAAVDYLAALGRSDDAQDRRVALDAAYAAITNHERTLCAQRRDGRRRLDGIEIGGIDDPARLAERVATVSFVHPSHTPRELCQALAERGVFTWDGHSYAVPLAEALGLLPHGVLRAGVLHYHDETDLERFVAMLGEILER